MNDDGKQKNGENVKSFHGRARTKNPTAPSHTRGLKADGHEYMRVAKKPKEYNRFSGKNIAGNNSFDN